MTKIYYFSGTGNSLWSAKKIAQILGDSGEECQLFNIGAMYAKEQLKQPQNGELIIQADAVVLVYPSYAFGLPLVVRDFVKKAEFKANNANGLYLASFVTYGSTPLGTQGIMRRILKKKKIDNMFFGKIPAVENYLAMFGAPDKQTIEKRSEMQRKATEQAARSVIERKTNRVSTFCPFSTFVVWLFYFGIKIFYKYYRVSDNCSGCAVCEKVCPVSAITMKNSHPQFSSKCQNCQGCVNICPSRAIQFGRVKFGTPGYCHPEIRIGELGAR